VKTERPRAVLAGRYALEEPIGRGDAGMVWRALDTVLDRTVVAKLFRPDLSESPGFAEAFTEAARTAASVHHPGLVPLLDVGIEDGVVYLVREHVEGESLAERIASEGWPEPAEAGSMARQIREALDAAKRAGIESNGVRPENVLLGSGGRVRVTDVGLAGLVRASSDTEGDRLLLKLDEIALKAPSATSTPSQKPSWIRSWLLVPIAVVVVGGAALAIGLSLGKLQVGGPLGVRLHHQDEKPPSPPATVKLQVSSLSVFDPYPGDGAENDGGLPYAIDGDPATVWKSENYFDGRLNKPGVGVLLDLGRRRTVTGFRLDTPAPGFRFSIAIGDDPGSLVASAGPEYTAAQDMRESFAPETGRYVLFWITTVVPVPDGNRAEIADLEVMGEA
jgi:hypothetical protein